MTAANEELPEEPPEEFEYVLVDTEYGPRWPDESGMQVWEVCPRDVCRVQRVEQDGETYWSCEWCDYMEPAQNRQMTLDGVSVDGGDA